MRFISKTKKWQRAREIGVNLDDVMILELLGREWITMEEGATILQISRPNLFGAMERGTLKVKSRPHGAGYYHQISPDDLMEFAVNRRDANRIVDVNRATEYELRDRQQP